MAIRICSNREGWAQDGWKLFGPSTDPATELTGIICCITRMTIRRGDCCKIQVALCFGSVLKVLLELRKALVLLQKGEGVGGGRQRTESFISSTSLCSVALMTRFNAYVSAARARNTDARPSPAAPGQHQSPKCKLWRCWGGKPPFKFLTFASKAWHCPINSYLHICSLWPPFWSRIPTPKKDVLYH